MVRAFIGITLPEDVKRYVVNIQEKLKSLPIKAKFVEPENLHVSLSFLGELGAEIESISFKLDELSKVYRHFEFVLGGIMLIPNEKSARVIAIDIKSETLESLRKEIVKSIGGQSHPAHLTLARIKNINDKVKFIENIKNVGYNELYVKIDSICLIESILAASGPVYTILHRSYFK